MIAGPALINRPHCQALFKCRVVGNLSMLLEYFSLELVQAPSQLFES